MGDLLSGLVRSWNYLQGNEKDHFGRVQIPEKMSYSGSEFLGAEGCSYPIREVSVCVCVCVCVCTCTSSSYTHGEGKPEFVSRKLLLLNQTWVHFRMSSEANLLTPGCGEGKCSFIVRHQ